MTASAPSAKKKFLLIGIAWNQYGSMVPAEKVDETILWVKKALERDARAFEDAGLDYQFVEYAPGDSMSRLEGVLGEKRWDGVCVGVGIRVNRQFTRLFEELVNTVHEKSPGSKLLFNSQPDDTIEAVKRWWPELGK